MSCRISSLRLGLVLDRLERLGLGWCRRRWPGRRPRGLARAVQRELEWTAGRGDVVRAVDGARAELTNQAMGNVGNLVMTGQALVQVAPESAPYLEALLGAYATGAAQAIARFR